MMSHVPLGKVLLRNVIRHTDAHNKIQEESEMWKIRKMEKQSKDICWGKQERMLPKSASSRMRSDGFDEESQTTNWKTRNLASMSAAMEDDLRHARYWNKKLYECEANMPDRWGHSGYRELYPEEFDTDSDGERDEQNSMNGKRKRQLSKQSSLELPPRKKAKKSHKKKQKKKSHKKRKKKKKREQPSTAPDSSQGSECSEEEGGTRKRNRPKKASARPPTSFSGQGSDSSKAASCPSGSSEDNELEGKQEKQRRKKRRKHHSSVSERGGERVQEKRSKRKNWKVAADENSEDSSDED